MQLISGNTNLPLAQAISEALNVPLLPATIRHFADQEIFVEIHSPVAGKDVFVLQPTAPPVNNSLMELLVIVDALKRGGARKVIAVVPYFGYARQDRQTAPVAPLTAHLVANLLIAAGVDALITCELHSEEVLNFFKIPLINLTLIKFFAQDISQRFKKGLLMVAPDAGGITRARGLADYLRVDLATMEKYRYNINKIKVLRVAGPVPGKVCIIIDDIVDSGQTLCCATEALLARGALAVHAYATHGILAATAVEQIQASSLKSLTLSNTVNIADKLDPYPKIRFLSAAPLFAQAISTFAQNFARA